MHITIDTSQPMSGRDRRVLAALIGDDNGPLVLPRFPGTDDGVPPAAGEQPAPAPPLPVPVPPAFASKLGEAVAQFSPRGSGSEARLPFAQQAGVRTSSTMPDDDDGEPDVLSHRPDDAAPEQPEEVWVEPVERPDVVRAAGGMTVARELVEDAGAPRRIEDVTRAAILGVVEQPPVRHTSP